MCGGQHRWTYLTAAIHRRGQWPCSRWKSQNLHRVRWPKGDVSSLLLGRPCKEFASLVFDGLSRIVVWTSSYLDKYLNSTIAFLCFSCLLLLYLTVGMIYHMYSQMRSGARPNQSVFYALLRVEPSVAPGFRWVSLQSL